jgi:hypothetical protein
MLPLAGLETPALPRGLLRFKVTSFGFLSW